MFEAIGLAEYGNYFGADRPPARTGRARVPPDDRRARLALRALPPPARTGSSRRSSPARSCPRSRRSRRSVARTRLQINGVEEIGFGYARTLREWHDNVLANVEQIRALGYDERFLRIWTFYLSYCEAGFAIRSLRDMQIVLSHSANDALPAFPSVRPGY